VLPKLKAVAALAGGAAAFDFSISFSTAFAAALCSDLFCSRKAAPQPDPVLAEVAAAPKMVPATFPASALGVGNAAGLSAGVLPTQKLTVAGAEETSPDFFSSISF